MHAPNTRKLDSHTFAEEVRETKYKIWTLTSNGTTSTEEMSTAKSSEVTLLKSMPLISDLDIDAKCSAILKWGSIEVRLIYICENMDGGILDSGESNYMKALGDFEYQLI
ncbi:hypothetical protein DIC82_19020 [Clostridium beijerinckii]|nr:hypothetical protein DIC82_19020 [Clostridium beijerinckii]